jgi:hypothetical protein
MLERPAASPNRPRRSPSPPASAAAANWCWSRRRTCPAPRAPGQQHAREGDRPRVSHREIGADPLWEELFPAEQARIVQLLVQRIDLKPNELRLRTQGLGHVVQQLGAVGDDLRRAA